MSGRVNVLAVLDHIADCDYIPVSSSDLAETRDAVADLIEAAKSALEMLRQEREILSKCHTNPLTGTVDDEPGQDGIKEFDDVIGPLAESLVRVGGAS